MGWAAAAYQHGILATHSYWIGAIHAMLFLGLVMMPFYYLSNTHALGVVGNHADAQLV